MYRPAEAMTRDLKPTVDDLRRLVEIYGSLAHLAHAVGVAADEMRTWLRGDKEIPSDYYEAILALVTKDKK